VTLRFHIGVLSKNRAPEAWTFFGIWNLDFGA